MDWHTCKKKGFQVIIYHTSAEPLSPKTNNDCGGNLLIQAFSSLPLFTILLRNCNASPSSPMRQWAERGIEIAAYHSLGLSLPLTLLARCRCRRATAGVKGESDTSTIYLINDILDSQRQLHQEERGGGGRRNVPAKAK